MAEVLTSGVAPGRTFASSSKMAARTSVSVLRRIAAILAYIIVGLLIWQGFIVAFDVDPLVVPGPLPVIESLAMQLTSPVIWAATWVTFQEAIFGFGIGAAVGILIAIVLSESRLLYKLINPYIVAFQAIPKVALTPLFIVWFGFGIWSKVVLIATFTFFPVMVNMYQGLRSTSNEEEELMRVSHATRWQRFRHLRLYRSLPYLFAAFEASFVLCLTGAVLAELLGSGTSVGLGTLVQM
jgi:NitT/TauT family transport system permease protein